MSAHHLGSKSAIDLHIQQWILCSFIPLVLGVMQLFTMNYMVMIIRLSRLGLTLAGAPDWEQGPLIGSMHVLP